MIVCMCVVHGVLCGWFDVDIVHAHALLLLLFILWVLLWCWLFVNCGIYCEQLHTDELLCCDMCECCAMQHVFLFCVCVFVLSVLCIQCVSVCCVCVV